MELRLGTQQRHSITAVLLSAVVIIFGLVIADMFSGSEHDPLGTQIGTVDAPSSPDDTSAPSNDDLTADVVRSNARFTLNPDVTTGLESSTTTAVRRQTTTTAAVVATTASPTSATTTVTEPPTTSSTVASSTASTTTATTMVTTTNTTLEERTTTTKKCRGKRPGCRQP